MLRPVALAMSAYLKEKFQALDTRAFIEKGCPRGLLGKLVGASEDEICYAPNTSYGINVTANSLPIEPGMNAVLWELEFPGNLYPWLKQRSRGLEIRWLRGRMVDASSFERMVDRRTVVVAISHVNWVNGLRVGLKEISEIVHRNGGFLFVDATQSAGAMQVDVRKMGVDVLASAFYKWLLGPSGAGFLYVRDDLIEKLDPPFIGWNAVKNTGPPSYLFNPKRIVYQDHAGRYLPGSMSPIPFLGAGVALRMLLDRGISNIERRVLDLTGHLIDGLDELGVEVESPRERASRGGIVSFKASDPAGLEGRLREKKIRVSARSQEGVGGIRVSPHFYNTESEITTFLRTLSKLINFRAAA
jgi:selenocysteine lyase/cysteine desulfurase